MNSNDLLHNDDIPVGRALGRREALALLGAVGTSLFIGGVLSRSGGQQNAIIAAGSCVASPEMTIGPYFVDEELNRSDIRTDPTDGTTQTGVPLTLALYVMDVSGNACTPLAGALVDIWHCNALGLYSDEQVEGTAGKKYLRGYQTTDASGMVQFTTIYPGWYTGRAVHIHAMVRTSSSQSTGAAFTTQFFFDDTLTDQVHTQAPYNTRGTRNTRNSQDNIYANGGNQMLLPLTGSNAAGYAATFSMGLTGAMTSPTDTPSTAPLTGSSPSLLPSRRL
jgi:protocatechuate 3,4-dioxygenase beta subunit